VDVMTSIAPPPDITSQLVQLLFNHWEQQRGARFAPSWREIDPGQIRQALPYVSVADVLEQPFDVRYRLVGTAVVDAVGYEFTGRTLRSMTIATGIETWLAQYGRVVADRRPHYGVYHGVAGSDLDYKVDHVSLPLSDDGSRVNRIMELEDWSMIRNLSPTRLGVLSWRFDPSPSQGFALG
jgi:hypothetical protein